MKNEKVIAPFRWDVSHQEQLGSLISGPKGYLLPPYYREVVECAAKVLARCDNGDLYFVGRSADSLYDFLKGALKRTSWHNRLHLLHFSFFYEQEIETLKKEPEALKSYHLYLSDLGLDPVSLMQREAPVVFVDLVFRGVTLGRLINLIKNWCGELEIAWEQVKGKIRVVGIVRRSEATGYYWERLNRRYLARNREKSIKTRRRQTQKNKTKPYGDWPNLLQPGAVNFFAAPTPCWNYLADQQPKMAVSFKPDRWGKEWVALPKHQPEQVEAVKIGLAFYQEGDRRAGRLRLVLYMSREAAMEEAWFRGLLGEISKQ